MAVDSERPGMYSTIFGLSSDGLLRFGNHRERYQEIRGAAGERLDLLRGIELEPKLLEQNKYLLNCIAETPINGAKADCFFMSFENSDRLIYIHDDGIFGYEMPGWSHGGVNKVHVWQHTQWSSGFVRLLYSPTQIVVENARFDDSPKTTPSKAADWALNMLEACTKAPLYKPTFPHCMELIISPSSYPPEKTQQQVSPLRQYTQGLKQKVVQTFHM